jgi:hypothetical protein
MFLDFVVTFPDTKSDMRDNLSILLIQLRIFENGQTSGRGVLDGPKTYIL